MLWHLNCADLGELKAVIVRVGMRDFFSRGC